MPARWLVLCFMSVLGITLFFCNPRTDAQTETATIRGRIADPTGALVPNASVRLVDIDRGTKKEARSDNSGFYSFANVQPGRYRMEVEKIGFKLVHLTGITANVQDNLEENFKLDLGAVSESVTVEAGGVNLNTTDGSVGTVVDRQFVENLPLNGRTFQTLIGLAPGAVLATTPFDDGQFSVNGQRANANYFTVDGVSANIGVNPALNPNQAVAGTTAAFSALGTTSNLVSIDAMQEFNIQTSTFAPEYGRTPGAQVSVVTRSGTNEFHGTLFEYLRNDALDATDWFANRQGLRKPALRQNDFGGVFGGPIIKDRTFFFSSYEGLRLRLPQVFVTQVPSLAARQAAPAQIQPFLNAFPIPNGQNLPNNASVFAASFSDPSNLDSTGIRVDHTFGRKWSLFGRYSYAPSLKSARGLGQSLAQVVSGPFRTDTATAGLATLLSPHISNDVRVNYSRNSGEFRVALDTFGGAAPPPDSLFLPSPFTSKNSNYAFVISGLTGGQFNSGLTGRETQRQMNVIDTLSLQKGSHALKYGVDYRRLFPRIEFFHYFQLIVTNGVNGALSGTSLLSTVQSGVGVPLFPVFVNLSLFGQDTWRVRPRLTVTYGARWEVNPAPKESNGRDAYALTNVDNLPSLAFASPGSPLYRTTYRNFAPRIGVAYQLSQAKGWETVLRGGWGLFYDLGNGQAAGQYGFNFPNTAARVMPGATFPLSAVQAAPPPISLTPPFGNVSATDPNLELPYTHQWNITLEQSLGSHQRITSGYIGAIGRRLLRQEVLANPNANFSTINLTRNGATSDYHALQVEYLRRLSRGLQALGSYTWSHSIDVVSTDGSFEAPIFKVDLANERGSSSFDVRHAFNLAVTYDIPRPERRGMRALLGEWSVESIFRTRSGLPINVSTGNQTVFAIGFFGGLDARPDLVPGVPLYVSDPAVAGGRRINRAAFDSTTPSNARRQGTLGRNVVRGFGMWQADFAVRRQFRLTDRLALLFRAEFFNIFNHPNFADPGSVANGTNVLTSAQFGQSLSMLARGQGGVNTLGLNPLYQIGGPRSTQLGLKLVF